MGGLNPMIIEITELVKAARYDYVIIETVGVGQSEVEIAGLADTTVVVLVPEAGDEVQTMKAGLMEIADIFVVNKSDRPGADTFVKNLKMMMAPAFSTHEKLPVIKTIAHEQEGINALFDAIKSQSRNAGWHEKRLWLLTEKIFQLIQKERMRTVDKQKLHRKIADVYLEEGFNLYRIAEDYKLRSTMD
jgi:LAO/AO transport system kinase